MVENLNEHRAVELRVVLDTSTIFSASINDFCNQELLRLIRESVSQTDIVLRWFIPEIVLLERRYQMINQAKNSLPAVRKLEKYLGKTLGVVDDAIDSMADEIIQRVLSNNKIEIINLEVNKVNWQEIINNSVNRQPPFDPGDTEKGFRDALVAEYYMQLLDKSQVDPEKCKVVLATKDDLLQKAITNRISDRSNTYPPSSLQEIRGLINALAMKVNIDLLNRFTPRVSEFFYKPNSKECLFIEKNLPGQIEQKFKSELEKLPDGAEWRVNDAWIVSQPEFRRSKDHKFTWINQVTLEHSAHRTSHVPINPGISGPFNPFLGAVSQNQAIPTVYSGGTFTEFFSSTDSIISQEQLNRYSGYPSGTVGEYYTPQYITTNIRIATGRSVFEIEWSVEIADSDEISNVQIEEIRLLQVRWD